MPVLLPPTPIGVPPGSSYWNDWYEKLRYLINNGAITTLWTNINFAGSSITDIVDREHNNLQSIQGGAPGDYYHLTAAQVASIGVTTPPGGSTTQIQFNDAGAFGGDADFTWNKTSNTLTFGTGSTISGITVVSTSSVLTIIGHQVTNGPGGAVAIRGAPSTNGGGGKAGVYGATATALNQTGGDVELIGGLGGNGGTGGHALIQPGPGGGAGNPGNIKLDNGRNAALSTTTVGGFITMSTMPGTPTGTPVNVPTGSYATTLDSSNKRVWVHDGTSWRRTNLGGVVNGRSADYTCTLSDGGPERLVLHPSTDANNRTFTIPANSSVAYDVGTQLTFLNDSANNVTIAITTDTLVWEGTGATGSRTLAQYGKAIATKISSTPWYITGTNLT